MKIIRANTENLINEFCDVSLKVYNNIPYYRNTDNDVFNILLSGKGPYFQHAVSIPFVIINNNEVQGRFFLIWDTHLNEYVQLAFFEAFSGISNLSEEILHTAAKAFPEVKKLIVGLNGHLNYGAGILLNHFDKVPLLGLNYNLEYYKDYFAGFKTEKLFTYRFPVTRKSENFNALAERVKRDGFSIRTLKKSKFRKEVEVYTYLNNLCFADHSYWTKRTADEDFEIFAPFRHLLREENFLIVEKNNTPVGFILWFPDFNEMVSGIRELRAGSIFGMDVLRSRMKNKIRTFRLTEIGVVPEFQKKGVELLLLHEMMKYVRKRKLMWGEGGFIMENNEHSNLLAKRYIERVSDVKTQPYREYGMYISNIDR